jgi:triacylglycerol lipase
MKSRYLVDPELTAFLDLQSFPQLSQTNLAEVRASRVELARAAAVPEGLPVILEEILVPGPADAPPVRVLIYRPSHAAGPWPALLHIHGGGYVYGLPEMNDGANRKLAAELGCAVFSVDYRLAPETPYPGALEDCYAVLKWLHGNAASLGIDTGRIGVKGESAGGGLAAALALLARDRGEHSLAFQHLIFPMIDDRTCTQTDLNPFVGEFIWTPERSTFGWAAWLGSAPGSAGIPAYAAPARAENLAGLPPAFIGVGTLDLFLEENMEYAKRLTRAGVPVEMHIYPGAYHGFQTVESARVTQAAWGDTVSSLRRAFYG